MEVVTHKELRIIKLGKEPVEVQQAAQAVFDDIFKRYHPYFSHIAYSGLLRLRYSAMGYIGYVISFNIEAPAEVVTEIAAMCPDDEQAIREAQRLHRVSGEEIEKALFE